MKKINKLKNKKFISILLVALLSLGLIFLFRDFLFWKTHVDERGFLLSYPASWAIRVKSGTNVGIEFLVTLSNKPIDLANNIYGEHTRIPISRIPKTTDNSFAETISKIEAIHKSKVIKTKLQDRDAAFLVSEDEHGIRYNYYIDSKDYIYSVDLWLLKNNVPKVDFLRRLNGFRIINSFKINE